MSICKVIGTQFLTANTFRLRTERPSMPFKAGQCFNVGIPDTGINREYSIYSGADEPYLEFLIRLVDDGAVSGKLACLSPGDEVEIDGPFGIFCVPEDAVTRRRNFYFVATGTGIAPFHSFVMTYPSLRCSVIHGVRFSEENYGAEDFGVQRYTACISRGSSECKNMRVTDYLKAEQLDGNSHYFLCGNRHMIIDVFEILRSKNISSDNIFTEVFF